MSIRIWTAVWTNSRHSGSELLMLLALADFADDEGLAYPSIATLARKCRMSTRNVNLILAQLRKGGELEVRQNAGPNGANVYRIRMPAPLKNSSPPPPEELFTPEEGFTLKPASSPPEAGFPIPLKPASAKPSVNRQEPSTGDRASARQTPSPTSDRARKAQSITFDAFANRKASAGEMLIDGSDPIFDWADAAGIPEEWISLAWAEFSTRYRGNTKRYADWPAAFRNAVRNNWFEFWRVGADGGVVLTTKGELARRAAKGSTSPNMQEAAA